MSANRHSFEKLEILKSTVMKINLLERVLSVLILTRRANGISIPDNGWIAPVRLGVIDGVDNGTVLCQSEQHRAGVTWKQKIFNLFIYFYFISHTLSPD